jgi:hypothetical protein
MNEKIEELLQPFKGSAKYLSEKVIEKYKEFLIQESTLKMRMEDLNMYRQ